MTCFARIMSVSGTHYCFHAATASLHNMHTSTEQHASSNQALATDLAIHSRLACVELQGVDATRGILSLHADTG